jgi:hypothetical protein
LYSSPDVVRVNKSRRMKGVRHVARLGEMRGIYSILVGTPEGSRSLGRPKHRWEDNIEVNHKGIELKMGTGFSGGGGGL